MIAVGVVYAVLIGVGLRLLFTVTYLVRLIDRRTEQHLRRVSHRARVVSG
ncbi:hypothetical protein ACFO9E_11165 [Streptomyces maoxianensis]|uniref:Uncharacterized protein n=1 Tax=Streptomyces maoxianensis TaxID=1459942 RepID=A0ABV9G5G8_9ACTN